MTVELVCSLVVIGLAFLLTFANDDLLGRIEDFERWRQSKIL